MHQEHTAMKVCTDACLFGAWLAKDQTLLDASSILDIGTGTGLLSLMVAQVKLAKLDNHLSASNFQITAIEIEPLAAAEAIRNFNLSPWVSQLTLLNCSLQTYDAVNNTKSFDCIFTNPPFFEGDLASPNPNKNIAAHSSALPWTILIQKVNELLNEDGYYYVLIPALRAYTMQKLADQNGLKLLEEVVVFNAAHEKPFRVMQKYKKTNQVTEPIRRSNFIIKEADQNYTAAFTDLLKDYYLHL